MASIEIFLIFIFFFIVLLFFRSTPFGNSRKRFPPGPPEFPLIGSLLSVLWADATDPAKAFSKLSKKYGPIVGLRMGSVPLVAISGYETLNRVANSEHLLTRVDESDIWLTEKTSSIPLGMVFGMPDIWAKTRAFSIKGLRKHGFLGVSKNSGFILDQIVDFCDNLKAKMTKGQVTLSVTTLFHQIFFNIVWMFLTGNKYGTSEATQKKVLHDMEEYMRSSKFAGNISQIYPQLITIFPELTGFNKLKSVCASWRNSLMAVLGEARQDGGYQTHPSNFLEDFLQKVDATPRPTNLRDSIFTDENILAVCGDFPLGGTDTQSIAMKLILRFLMQYPEVQAKAHEEVLSVVGNSRLVSVSDIPELKYVQAIIAESLRLGDVVPIVARKLLQDWDIEGYQIPKGTLVILNIWSGDNDEEVYKDSEVFKPERFLGEDGSLLNTEKVMSFGFGKRRCIAESLARIWITLLCATMIQNFSFHVDPTFGTKWGTDGMGLTRSPAPYNVIIKSREYFEP